VTLHKPKSRGEARPIHQPADPVSSQMAFGRTTVPSSFLAFGRTAVPSLLLAFGRATGGRG
jgi:hypothetical protein